MRVLGFHRHRPRPAKPALLALPLLLVLGLAAPAFGASFPVDSTADGVDLLPGDGVCATAGGACTLRAAIQETNALAGADDIALPAGTYLLTLPGAGEDAAASGDLDVTGDLQITGAGAALTVVDGNGTATGDRVFHVLDPAELGLTASFSGLTVRGGRVLNENGGGLLITTVEGGGPNIGEPGAVGVEMLDCVVAGNRAFSNQQTPGGEPIGGSGGGIYAGGPLVATLVAISGNHADANGGGAYSGAALTLIDTTVAANHAENGGGMFVTGAAISEVTGSAVVLNTAVGGGGVSSRAQTFLVLTNSTIDGNSATDVGAGINTNGTVSLDRTTVTANRSGSDAPSGGAGLNSFSGGDFRLSNTLLADNVVNAVGELPEIRNCGCTGGGGCTPGIQFLSLGHNLENGDGCTFREATDQPVTEPFLGPLHPLGGPTPVRAVLEDSPAIDTGALASCPATDQRGAVRPVDGNGDLIADCDIGAFEVQVPEWAIFYDSFERGDTSRWSSATP